MRLEACHLRGLRAGSCFWGFALLVLVGLPARADDAADTRAELQRLRQQNQALQEQLHQQQGLLEALSRKVDQLNTAAGERAQSGPQPSAAAPRPDIVEPAAPAAFGVLGKLNISGEGGVAYFQTGSQGMFSKGEFRMDEARLFFEAPVSDHVYLYTELNLATREEPDVQVRLGEAYLDWEKLVHLWNCDRLLNVRVGRLYSPFGEEYLTRYAIDNPLISHSLADLWSVDEGIELYGGAGHFTYALAVQNGGIDDTHDFTSDKSVAGRIGFDPAHWLHLSVSGMRTGDLDSQQDMLSALWFGNGFFRSLGSSATSFHANLAELDAQVRLPHGHLAASGGYIHYDDNALDANNARDVYYYSAEAVHDLCGKLYAGARFSQVYAPDGFPLIGQGDFGDYFYGPLTRQLWRLSLGLGYRWNQNLLLKAEYSFERGRVVGGETREHEDQFAFEAAFKF